MMTLYTALGTYHTTPDGTPCILSDDQEFALDTHELLLWSILAFQILTYDEIRREFYEKERELHIMADTDLDHYLNRLTVRRLIISGRDESGMDALYDLFGRLYLKKTPDDLFTKLTAFLDLWLFKHIPFRKAKAVFESPALEPLEKKLLRMIDRQLLSTAELIQCAARGRFDIQDSGELIDCLYADGETDYQSIVADTRTMDERRPVPLRCGKSVSEAEDHAADVITMKERPSPAQSTIPKNRDKRVRARNDLSYSFYNTF